MQESKPEVKEIRNTIRETIKAQKAEGRPMLEAGKTKPVIIDANQ